MSIDIHLDPYGLLQRVSYRILEKKSVPKPKPKVLKSEISSVNEHPVLRKSTRNKNGEILGNFCTFQMPTSILWA